MGLILLNIALPEDKRPWAALLIGMAAIAFVMFKPKRRFGARGKDPLEKPSSFGSLAQQRSVERQMQNLLVELSEMARQITGQIDTRAAKLELLIKDADERLAALRRTSSGVAPMPAMEQRAVDFRVGEQQSFTFASVPSTSASSSTPAPTAPAPAVTGPRMSLTYSQADDPDGPDPRHAEVYRLADQGRSPKEIAVTLGRPSGEIELILALRQRRAS